MVPCLSPTLWTWMAQLSPSSQVWQVTPHLRPILAGVNLGARRVSWPSRYLAESSQHNQQPWTTIYFTAIHGLGHSVPSFDPRMTFPAVTATTSPLSVLPQFVDVLGRKMDKISLEQDWGSCIDISFILLRVCSIWSYAKPFSTRSCPKALKQDRLVKVNTTASQAFLSFTMANVSLFKHKDLSQH